MFLQCVTLGLNHLLHFFTSLTFAACEKPFYFKTDHENFLAPLLHKVPERSLNTASDTYVVQDI